MPWNLLLPLAVGALVPASLYLSHRLTRRGQRAALAVAAERTARETDGTRWFPVLVRRPGVAPVARLLGAGPRGLEVEPDVKVPRDAVRLAWLGVPRERRHEAYGLISWIGVEGAGHGVEVAPLPALTVAGTEREARRLLGMLRVSLALPPEGPEPVLVFDRGPLELLRGLAHPVIFLGWTLVASVPLWLGVNVGRAHLPAGSLLQPPRNVELAIPVLVVFALLVARRLLRARIGRVELHEDRAVFPGDDEVAVRWDELAGFRDDSADHVLLVPRQGRRILGIPTREDERATLLAFLDRKGLRRLEREV